MFDMQDLHRKMLANIQINIHHPRILCIKNGLEKYRQRIDAAPEASIKVTLPITGYVKNYNTKLIDTVVQFDSIVRIRSQ